METVRDMLINSAIDSHDEAVNNIITEALADHGHTFESRKDMIDFIKSRCRAEFFPLSQTSYCYVDNVLYLIINQKPEFKYDFENNKASVIHCRYQKIAKP